jgi:hypothetical protein
MPPMCSPSSTSCRRLARTDALLFGRTRNERRLRSWGETSEASAARVRSADWAPQPF